MEEIPRSELQTQHDRLTALLVAKTAEMHQIGGAKALCEHLLSICDQSGSEKDESNGNEEQGP